MSRLRKIKRKQFETSGWRVIELARGSVEFPDGTCCRFNVRLQAQPGSEGDIVLIAEDINRERTITTKLRREK